MPTHRKGVSAANLQQTSLCAGSWKTAPFPELSLIMTFEVILKSHLSPLFSFQGFLLVLQPHFLSSTPLAEQGSEAGKGKEHLLIPPVPSCRDGAALGCWHTLVPDAVTLLEELGWGPRELLHPLVPLETTLTALSSLKTQKLLCKPLPSAACTLLSMRTFCVAMGMLCWSRPAGFHPTAAFPPLGLALPPCSLSAGAGRGSSESR